MKSTQKMNCTGMLECVARTITVLLIGRRFRFIIWRIGNLETLPYSCGCMLHLFAAPCHNYYLSKNQARYLFKIYLT